MPPAAAPVFRNDSVPARSALRRPLALLLILVGGISLAGAFVCQQSYQIYRQPDVHNRLQGLEKSDSGALYTVDAANRRLEKEYLRKAVACTALGLLLIGGGIWSYRETPLPPPEYAPIDWRETSRPPEGLTVQFTRWHGILFGLFALFLGSLILAALASNGVLLGKGFIVIGNGGALYTIGFLLYRARRNAVRAFDTMGVIRGDGRRFSWEKFRGVTNRIDNNPRMQRRYVWRTELAFAGGATAWVIPQHVKNLDEVFTYLAALPRARLLDGPLPASAPAIVPVVSPILPAVPQSKMDTPPPLPALPTPQVVQPPSRPPTKLKCDDNISGVTVTGNVEVHLKPATPVSKGQPVKSSPGTDNGENRSIERLKEAERQCEAQWDEPAFARLGRQQAVPFAAWAINQILREADKEFVPCDKAYESWDDMMKDLANYVYDAISRVFHSDATGIIDRAVWNLSWVCKRIDERSPSGRGPWEALLVPFQERALRQGEPRGLLPAAMREAISAIPDWAEIDPGQAEEASIVRRLEKNLGEKLAKAGLTFTLAPGATRRGSA